MANYTVNAYNNNGTGGSVNMRSGPSTSNGIIVQVPHGATVTGTKSGTWSQMTYGSYNGYMMSVYLDEQSGGGTLPSTTPGVISGTDVNVRRDPSTSNSAWTQVNTGDKVNFYKTPTYSGSGYTWYKCTSPSLKWPGEGYIVTKYVLEDTASTGGGLRLWECKSAAPAVQSTNTSYAQYTFPKGRMFYGTENGSYVDFYSPGTLETLRINKTYLTDRGAGSSNAATRVQTIAMNEAMQGFGSSAYGPASGDWCQIFVNWCARLAQVPNPTNSVYRESGCSSAIDLLGSQYKAKGTYSPKAGDWVYYWNDSPTAPTAKHAHHVGYLVYTPSGTTLTVIEGNRGGASVATFYQPIDGYLGTSKLRVIGYGVPPYK